MAQEFVINKLKSAGIVHEPWMNVEHLMFSKAFNEYAEVELSVYFGWLKEQRAVVRFLESGKLTEIYNDESGVSNHAQFERFKNLASDLIYPVLKSHTENIKDYHQALCLVSFSELLNEDHQDTIQDEIGYWLNTKRNEFSQTIQHAKSDQQVYNVFYNGFDNNFWQLLDRFNHRHYRIKAVWVEEFIAIIKHKHASNRLVRGVIGKVETLNLREDHKIEIRRLDNLVRNNAIKFENKKMPWKRLTILFVVVSLLIFGLTWLLNKEAEPFHNKEQEETSFMQLSKEERMEIDSIIKVYNGNSVKTITQEEDIYFQPAPTKLITINENNDGLFWSYYRNWIKHEKDQFAIQFNTKGNKHKQLPGTDALSTKKGNYKGTFYNESSKTALVIVFDEMNADYMFCKFVQPKERVSFTVNTQVEKLVVVPGGKMTSMLTKTEMPFTEFDEHFFRQLNRIYTVTDVGEPFKLVYKDMGTNGVVLIDLKKSLSL